MNDKKYCLGVSAVILVVRHLKLEPTEQNKIQTTIAEIDQLYGIERVSFDEKPQYVFILGSKC